MGTIYHHGFSYKIENFCKCLEMKMITVMLAIEFTLYLFTVYKGFGWSYLPIIGFIMLFTVVGSVIVFYMRADRYLLMIIVLLLNLGFVVQEIESGGDMKISGFMMKFGVAVVSAFLAAFFYKYLADVFRDDRGILVIMVIQFLICITMCLVGVRIGDMSGQGAVITLTVKGISITPFEVVKMLYLLVVSALLCKDKADILYVGSWRIQREVFLMMHTGFLLFFFLLCKELGTALVVYLTGMIMLWIYGKNRRWILTLLLLSIIGIGAVWFICDQILCPKVVAGEVNFPGIVEKLVKRFGTALHPEVSASDEGYQGTLGLEALTVGGFLGLDTERYRLPLPEASTDMVFANTVQTCGFLIGTAIIIAFFALLKRGVAIVFACKDIYFQGLSMSIVVLLSVESMIHIGYNIAVFPITGIPLYFVSQGFTAVVTAMVLAAVLLVISTGTVEGGK